MKHLTFVLGMGNTVVSYPDFLIKTQFPFSNTSVFCISNIIQNTIQMLVGLSKYVTASQTYIMLNICIKFNLIDLYNWLIT